jgi:hypothetical protein
LTAWGIDENVNGNFKILTWIDGDYIPVIGA